MHELKDRTCDRSARTICVVPPSFVGVIGGRVRLAIALVLLMRATLAAKAQPIPVPLELSRELRALEQGDVLEIPSLPLRDFPAMAYEKAGGGPQFLISDAPEYIPEPEGAVLRERVVPGLVRIYVYNCNGVEGSLRKITTVIRNLGGEPLHFRFLRYAYNAPSLNYGLVAKQALRDFYESVPSETVQTVPVGDAVPLDPAMEASTVAYHELVHGFYEVEIDQPARITVLQTDPSTPGPVADAQIETVLPSTHSGAGRGLYLTSDFEVLTYAENPVDTRAGPRQLVVADGKTDPWIDGTDSSTTGVVYNVGNYGVMYSIRISYTTSDSRGLALLTWNPNSQAQWCGHMGNVVHASEGKFPAGLIDLPRDRVGITSAEPDATILIQLFPPLPQGETGRIELTYSPPGACCLPTPLLLVPVDMELPSQTFLVK